jgi:hypothetical protein
MKVGVSLARLANETHVGGQRWELAGMITDVSASVLRDIQEQGQKAEQAKREQASEHRADGVVRVQEKTREASEQSGALTMARRLEKVQKPLSLSELTQAVSSDDRRRADTQAMIEILVHKEWATEIPRPKQSPLYKAGQVPPPKK